MPMNFKLSSHLSFVSPQGSTTRPAVDWLSRSGVCMALSVLGLTGCAVDRPLRTAPISETIRAELPPAAPAQVQVPARISDALAEPVRPAVLPPPEPRLDLLVNNAQARDVFLAIVADTRYSMLMHPDVSGVLSVTLRGVTVPEALDAIREVYGYDYKIEGRRITVYAPTLQTRIFTINYLNSQRVGSSELRVTSGASMSSSTGSNSSSASSGSSAGTQQEGSRVTTSSKTDFWGELAGVVRGLIGSGENRNVIVSPQAGILAVRAMPDELRQVDKFLKAAQVAVERQVMLEAKIIEVELRDGYQSGVNWGAFGTLNGNPVVAGVLGSGVSSTNTLLQGGSTVLSDVTSIPSVASGGGVFGLALATSSFGAVLGFLETQGDVQTLSSPRLATLNNQKAVLKVGTEDFFVTGVSSGTSSNTSNTNSSTTSTPTVTLSQFFSGISLDVTPQIDDGSSIMLHVHPSVTSVTEKTKQVDLGSMGNYRLPLASSSVNETDTLVRVLDGHIVAIGGLMQMGTNRTASGLPGTTDTPVLGALFGNRTKMGSKKEVVVLIKPSIIRTAQDWEAQTQRTHAILNDFDAARARVIRLDGSAQDATPKPSAK